jgi:hypothetical protein
MVKLIYAAKEAPDGPSERREITDLAGMCRLSLDFPSSKLTNDEKCNANFEHT